MALANVANILARRGLRVLMIDFDLEAPGLEQYFPITPSRIRSHLGVLDLLLSYKKSMARGSNDADAEHTFSALSNFIVPIYPSLPHGKLDLMPSGLREGTTALTAYAVNLRKFDWQDFFFNWDGETFFEWLRISLLRSTSTNVESETQYDVILVDSRTGVTELGGLCAYQLADAIVMYCAANHQNLEGTRDMVRDFTSPNVMNLRKDRALDVLIVPARVEQRDPSLLRAFQEQFNSLFEGYTPPSLKKSISFWDLMVPYEPQEAFDERVIVTPNIGQSFRPIEHSFQRLADAMSLLAEPSSPPRCCTPFGRIVRSRRGSH
jgi:cellulose biosynthesis protein BcsQ